MQLQTMRMEEVDGFSYVDFQTRWRKARIAALVATLADADCSPAEISTSPQGESQLLSQIPATHHDLALKSVFDQSYKLGRSAVRHFHALWDLDDIQSLLRCAAIPCFSGSWQARTNSQAFVMERSGCQDNPGRQAFPCDYWREALDGLIMGVSDKARLARHGSVGHGDSHCTDVLFSDEGNARTLLPRFGPIPMHLRADLAAIVDKFAKMGMTLGFAGYGDGQLFYQFEPAKNALCGSSAKIFHNLLRTEVSKRIGGIKLQDTGPLAVYGEKA